MDRTGKMNKLSAIVKYSGFPTYHTSYLYPDIPDKIKVKITKTYDPQIDANDIVAFIDQSVLGTGKAGTVFTLSGVYDKQFGKKPFYFNYTDIYSCYIEKVNGNDALAVRIKRGSTYHTYNDVKALKQVIYTVIPLIGKWGDSVTARQPGEIEKQGLTKKQVTACNGIIHGASVAAGSAGAGLAQIPLADTAIITPIQIAMITSLGAVFDIRLTESAAKAILASVTASFVGRGVAQILVGWIPGVGNAVNTATAAGLTEAVGWAAVAHFVQTNEDDRAKYRIEGMKAGYEVASDEFEAKLRKQAEDFINQKKVVAEEFANYQKLCKVYEDYIMKLQKELDEYKSLGTIVPVSTSDKLTDMKKQFEKLSSLKIVS